MACATPVKLWCQAWEQLNDFYANTVQLYERQFAVLKAIILFMVILGVLNAVIGFTASIELMPWVTAEAAAVGLVATILAGVIPALRARRIAIVDALRQAN